MVGSVIKAIGTAEFEDSPKIDKQFETGKSLYSVCSIPVNKGVIDLLVPLEADKRLTC